MELKRKTDVAIVGGGLSGGLIALALQRALPDLDVVLIEAGDRLGGNHRWSWFESDLGQDGTALMAEFDHEAWQGGYDVRFPAYARSLSSDYRSLGSDEFAGVLERWLNPGSIVTGASAHSMAAKEVRLDNGDTVDAAHVIDCRGITEAPGLNGGWQVFLGQHWRLDRSHGLTRPIIMDATVEQLGGYRFVYVLPMGPDEVFIEDTYYQDLPRLDDDELRQRIADYAAANEWSGQVVHEETGLLPVVTGGDFEAFQETHRIHGVARAGARGGLMHPLTSYTLPVAVKTAIEIAAAFSKSKQNDLPAMLESKARAFWRDTAFYRLLGTMLFGAADPAERYRVFERFYRLPENLVEHFYTGRSSLPEKARVLIGKPPVPIHRAIAALVSSSPPLTIPSRKDSQ